jgi:DNA-binding CsgD family transcriptional regulator
VIDRLVSAAACRTVTTQPIALLNVLNLLDEGIILLDDRCNTLWANTAFATTIRADPECDRILAETRRLAATVATAELACSSALAPPQALIDARSEVCTRVAQYALRAVRLGSDAAFMERPFDVVVSMTRVVRRLPDPEALVNRFGLTPCEASVARLLARGMPNRDIARTLAVSAHTARHHTESVLSKLGVHTRAAVGGAVLDPDWPARLDHDVPRPRHIADVAGTARRDGRRSLSETPDDRAIRVARSSSG